MTIWIYSGDRPSNGAKELSKLAGFKRVRTGKFVKNKDVIVNWGCSKIDPKFQYFGEYAKKWLNGTEEIQSSANKLMAFKAMSEAGVECVPWCVPENHELLKSWQSDDFTIVGRTKLTGHSGDGIVIMEKGEPLQPALLYTKYIFKVREFRVHVVGDKVIDTQQKIRDPSREPTSWKVRSHENGFLFARGGVVPNPTRDVLAVSAVKSLGLDFGATDIVEDKKGNFYVLEVNTAPGLEGQTITNYGEAFSAYGQN